MQHGRTAILFMLIFGASAFANAADLIPRETLAAYLPAALEGMPRFKSPAMTSMRRDWNMASARYGTTGRGGVVRIYHYANRAVSAVPTLRATLKIARDNELMVVRGEKLNGYDVLLTWDRKTKRSTAKILVDDEILVVVEVNDAAAFSAALRAARGVNLAGLAALRR